ncbi:MAG: sensor histidine kinase [Nitrospirota bacterium]
MFPQLGKSLKAKFFLLFFILNLSVILLVGISSYQLKKMALRDQAESSLSIMSAEVADKIDRYLNERLSDTRDIALHYSLYGLKTTTSNQNEVLSKYLMIYPYYEHISVINVEDIRIPERTGRPGDYCKTWYLPALYGVSTSSDMYISPLTDKPTMSFAAPIRDKRGRVVSILTTNLKLGYLWDIVDQIRRENEKSGRTGYAVLINKEGAYVAHPDMAKVLKENPADAGDPRMKVMLINAANGNSGTATYTSNGIEKVAAYSPLRGYGDYKGHGWSIVIIKNYSEIFSPMRRLIQIYLLLFLLTSAGALIVSTKLAHYLVRPILALKEGASIIGSGNFSMRIDTKSSDEIGDLARSFNRMAETLETREQELVRLEKEKADFTAMITHDIKSPLSTVLTYTDMILDGTISGGEELKTAITSVQASGEKILSLVDNYLVSSAIEAGKLHLNLQPLDVNAVIQDEIPLFRPQTDRRKIGLTFNKGDGLPRVLADKMQLDRAVSNLLNNAVKYATAGSSITISTSGSGNEIMISVADTGKGISEEDMKNIFSKYRRSKDTARIDGLGLGLFITKAIAVAHGGSVSVESKVGLGSTFTIILPAMSSMKQDRPE